MSINSALAPFQDVLSANPSDDPGRQSLVDELKRRAKHALVCLPADHEFAMVSREGLVQDTNSEHHRLWGAVAGSEFASFHGLERVSSPHLCFVPTW